MYCTRTPRNGIVYEYGIWSRERETTPCYYFSSIFYASTWFKQNTCKLIIYIHSSCIHYYLLLLYIYVGIKYSFEFFTFLPSHLVFSNRISCKINLAFQFFNCADHESCMCGADAHMCKRWKISVVERIVPSDGCRSEFMSLVVSVHTENFGTHCESLASSTFITHLAINTAGVTTTAAAVNNVPIRYWHSVQTSQPNKWMRKCILMGCSEKGALLLF